MQFNKHSKLEGKHATLGASNYHWTNYSDEKFEAYFFSRRAIVRGTKLHAYAAMAIELGIKQRPRQRTLHMYVNDVLQNQMRPEVVLLYSDRCFGTADAIGFDGNLLRIYDLKTGLTKANMTQLHIYAALFCLEYDFEPFELEYDLRIYQNDEIIFDDTDKDALSALKARIIQLDQHLRRLEGR